MKNQNGGTFLGLIIGMALGVAGALVVAIYVTKAPIPFIAKDPARAPLSEAAEAKRNQDWNPNLALIGKSPTRAASAAAGAATGAATAVAPIEAKATAPTEPTADPAKTKSAAADPFIYFVQVGAYRTEEDADAQKARLSLRGYETKVSEREQSGRAVFRVRVGPFELKDDADKVKEQLDSAGVEAVLVRIQR